MNQSPSLPSDELSLLEVSSLAEALMTPREIAILLDIDADRFEYEVIHRREGVWGKAFHKGRLKTKLELRKKIIALAKAGSPQAEILADNYLKSAI